MDLTYYIFGGLILILIGVCGFALMQNAKDADEELEEMFNNKKD